MNRNFGIGVLILCFSLSSVNADLATQIINIPPIIVQPEDLHDISQQMLEQDQIDRDQELAIRGLIGEDQKTTNAALALQQDTALDKVNQTLFNYRDYLLSRERARIEANSRKGSQYQELIALTENVDAMKAAIRTQQPNGDVIDKNYKILNELKDEMTTLNERLQAKDQSEAGAKMVSYKSRVSRLDLQLSRKQAQADELKNELVQKSQQVKLLKTELENKITEEQNQSVLAEKIKDLKLQLQDKEDQITALKTNIRSGQKTQAQADTLKEQLKEQQDKADLLKQELDVKTAQSDQMTLMVGDYQKKLESKNSSYNEQTRQLLAYKNNQTQMEGQIADLNARLQEKEAQIVKIKKVMYDLQGPAKTQDTALQAKDLNLSIMQQKITSLTSALASERQKQVGMPNSDEYEREFKKQSSEFQSLKVQLQEAQDEIGRKNEDLKYKDMEITRLKERFKISKTRENKEETLPFPQNDTAAEKLKQALDKIDQQGRMINILTQKLREYGQSVDFTKDAGK